METVAAIMAAIQALSDAVASGFKAKIAGEEQHTNRLIAQNTHIENVMDTNADVLTQRNWFKYGIYMVLICMLAYLVWKRQNGK